MSTTREWVGAHDDRLWSRFRSKAELSDGSTLVEIVDAVGSIPYGRPSDRTASGVVSEWRGTCSTKHALLIELVERRWPELEPRVVHRVYRLTPALAQPMFGAAADAVPEDGVIDVHSFLTVLVDGHRTRLDVTIPGSRWDGRSDMPLACGEGDDIPGGADPWTTKSELVRAHCDERRERVIEALGRDAATAGDAP